MMMEWLNNRVIELRIMNFMKGKHHEENKHATLNTHLEHKIQINQEQIYLWKIFDTL